MTASGAQISAFPPQQSSIRKASKSRIRSYPAA